MEQSLDASPGLLLEQPTVPIACSESLSDMSLMEEDIQQQPIVNDDGLPIGSDSDESRFKKTIILFIYFN